MVRMISPIVKKGDKIRSGKGFSIEELKEVGLNVGEARQEQGSRVGGRKNTVICVPVDFPPAQKEKVTPGAHFSVMISPGGEGIIPWNKPLCGL